MREILFRGKRVDNGEWVAGSLLQGKQAAYNTNGKYIGHKDCAIIVLSAALLSMKLQYCGECAVPYDDDNSFEVCPETVGRYTGLTDKNGNRIFEGDIIEAKTIDFGESRQAIIHYGEFYDCNAEDLFLGWYVKIEGECISLVQEDKCVFKICEVIGNIYDNPELLETEE